MAFSKAMLVMAIDIGTTYSGYAFSFQHEYQADKLKITTNKVWQDGDSCLRTSYKTPTCVLVSPGGQFDSFGYEAETKYSELAKKNQHTEWFLFRRFKMNLYKAEIRDTMELESVTGQRFDALSVFAMAIRYLKGHFTTSLQQKVADSEIQYVLTVPAIWDEDAKQFMRMAALKCGIPGEQLTLALEPEAASISCQALLAAKTFVEGFTDADDISATGSRYIVVDAGGGTVDTTVHEVVFGHLKELHKASGGGWGGTRVDEEFAVLLLEIFTSKVMYEFGKNHKSDQMELEKEFELNKKRVTGFDEKMATFRLPASLRETFSLYNSCSLEEHVAGLSGMVQFIGDKMRLGGQLMQSLMRPTIQNMVTHVKTLLEDPKCEGVSHILLVGGFSDSPFLQEMFRQEFPSVTVVTPLDAVLSVVKGAVIFGHDPGAISVRLSTLTYGIGTVTTFIEGKHDPNKLEIIEGQKKCNDIFHKFVTINEEVWYEEETPEHTFHPTHTGQTKVIVLVYKSTEENPTYTTDPSCTKMGHFTVAMPVLTGEKGRKVGVKFVIGGTELKVIAHEKTTGKFVNAVFNFVSNGTITLSSQSGSDAVPSFRTDNVSRGWLSYCRIS